jgi:hypothetical protein
LNDAAYPLRSTDSTVVHRCLPFFTQRVSVDLKGSSGPAQEFVAEKEQDFRAKQKAYAQE